MISFMKHWIHFVSQFGNTQSAVHMLPSCTVPTSFCSGKQSDCGKKKKKKKSMGGIDFSGMCIAVLLIWSL